jgi:sugar phosphate permease
MPSALGRRAFDCWLATICAARTLLYANFMVFAACLPLPRQAWDITYAQAGAVGSGFILGYALSLLGSSWAADHYGARRIALISAVLSAVSAMAFGFIANSYQSALVLYALAGLTQGGHPHADRHAARRSL